MWAMSMNRIAPTSAAISAIRSKSQVRGYADAPPTMSFGRTSRAWRRHRVVIDALGVLADAVGMDLVEPAREVERHAVRQVAAVGEVHAHDPVARLEHAEVGGHVGLRAGVRLDVDVLGAGIERQRALLRQALGDVDELAAAVVALARQALGVLVGQPRALGFHDRRGDVVLARDELDLVVLPASLAEHRLPEDGIELRDRFEREARRWRDRHRVAAPFLPLRGARSPRAGAPPCATDAPEGYLPTNGTTTETPRTDRRRYPDDARVSRRRRRSRARHTGRRRRPRPRRRAYRCDGERDARTRCRAPTARQDAQEPRIRPAAGPSWRGGPDRRDHRRGRGLRRGWDR